MPKLILVRHAAPAADPRVAAQDWMLSAAGRERCLELAKAVAPYLPAALFASREAKALETAALTAGALGASFAPWPGLQEHARATVGWLSPDAFWAAMERLFARPSEVVFGDESADEAHTRFAAAVGELLAENPGRNVVIFTHGTILALYVSRAAPGISAHALWRQLGMPAVVVLSRPDLTLERVIAEVSANGA